uniref:Replication initiator protein n=1 Tax=Dulem virus 86 TaxID=3145797 RepID=A0AAU8AWV0_9VIRU
MICFSPIRLKNPKFDKLPNQPRFLDVPCGKCPACLSNKRREWLSRLIFESECHTTSLFVTLTYNDDNLPYDKAGNPCFDKRQVQNFLKRLRKRLKGIELRYFLVSEYGDQGKRPHYHAIFFGLPYAYDLVLAIQSEWKYGYVKIDLANPQRMNYCCKYVLFKSDIPEGREKPFMLCSKRPCIGFDFFLLSELNSLIEQIPLSDLRFKAIVIESLELSEISFYPIHLVPYIDKKSKILFLKNLTERTSYFQNIYRALETALSTLTL